MILTIALASAMLKLPLTEYDAWKDITSGHCSSSTGLPGTGISKTGGWVISPVPGEVEICTPPDGTITTLGNTKTVSHCILLDMAGGKPHAIIVHSSEPTKLTWKIPGYFPGPVPLGYQYPP